MSQGDFVGYTDVFCPDGSDYTQRLDIQEIVEDLVVHDHELWLVSVNI